MRTWIKQDPKKKNCGIIAVAVIAGISVEEAAKAVGKNGSTTTKQLAKGLRKLGYTCPDRCSKSISKPLLGLGQVHFLSERYKHKYSRNWHWVVIDKDKIFDGIRGDKNGNVNWPSNWCITSYLPVSKI